MISSTLAVQAVVVFLASLILTPLVRAAAIRYELFDKTNDRKVHSGSIPRIGGVAFFLSFLVSVLLFVDLNRPSTALVVGCLLLFVMGLIDDLRSLKPLTKLGFQIAAALIVLAGGIGIVDLSLPFIADQIRLDGWQIPLNLFGEEYTIMPIANAFTALWIILIINAINFLDGLDGLAAGVSSIAFITLLALSGRGFGNEIVVIMSTFMLMSLLGFLVSNFHPARIFMGDSGAYVLGLLLAVLPIYATTKTTIGLLVIGLAIVDLMLAVFRRVIKGKSPFSPDRGHLHHRLIDSGFKHLDSVIIFYLVAAATAVVLVLFSTTFAVLFLFVATVLLLLLTKPKS